MVVGSKGVNNDGGIAWRKIESQFGERRRERKVNVGDGGMRDGGVREERNIREQRRQVNSISTHAPLPHRRPSPPLSSLTPVRHPTRLISIFMVHLERLRFPGRPLRQIPVLGLQ